MPAKLLSRFGARLFYRGVFTLADEPASVSTPRAVACCPASYAVMCFVMRAYSTCCRRKVLSVMSRRAPRPNFWQSRIWLRVTGIGDGTARRFQQDARRRHGVIHAHHTRLVATQHGFLAMLQLMEADVER